MSRLFYHTMQDNAGNLLFGVSGTMRIAGTGTNATIYGDEALTVILPNPMTNHASFGSFKCFLGAGDYDFYMAKAGYTFETLTGVQGHGTMAQQDASAVNITGGAITAANITAGTLFATAANIAGGDITAANITSGLLDATTITAYEGFNAPQNAAANAVGFYTNMAIGGTNRWAIFAASDAPSSFGGNVIITTDHTLRLGTSTPAPAYNSRAEIVYSNTISAINFLPTSDATPYACVFRNAASALVGSITTTGAGTSYNTTSDGRLKHAIEAMTGALDVVRALNPVTFLWNADGSPGRGLVAQEVAAVVPGVVSGDGASQAPMGIDYSKLVPYLIGAVKELTQQVEMLQAQLAEAGA